MFTNRLEAMLLRYVHEMLFSRQRIRESGGADIFNRCSSLLDNYLDSLFIDLIIFCLK